jgi:hypothetical protein
MSSVSEQEVQQFRSSHDRQLFVSDQEMKQGGIHFRTRNEAVSFAASEQVILSNVCCTHSTQLIRRERSSLLPIRCRTVALFLETASPVRSHSDVTSRHERPDFCT